MKLPAIYLFLIAHFACLMSCSQKKPEQNTVKTEIDSVVILPDSIISTEAQSQDSFSEAISQFSKNFPKYNPSNNTFVETIEDYSNHWFFPCRIELTIFN